MASMRRQAWWKIATTDEENQKTIERISSSAGPSQHYFVLLVLSTLIAAYGLVSNSTATVIGAMIVAPLMGPILGLALAMVRDDSRTFYRSFWAEFLGVSLVVATGMLVAFLVGPENIDYALREIAGRTRPTLYDLAIGLMAGLAGAYCSVSPRLQASIAGVAIAVALVPPLAVTGLTLAGAFYGYANWSDVLGSFMLFFANFLTIEMAAVVVFLLAGVGEIHSLIGKRGFLRHFGVQVVLLVGTGVFLSNQLHSLVRERQYQRVVREVLTEELRRIPGANLDSLDVTLHQDRQLLNVVAVVGSRKEILPPTVRTIQSQLNTRLDKEREPANASLVIRTVESVYASATGFLYEPPASPPDPKQVRLQELESALREGLKAYPGMEVESFRELPSRTEGTIELLVTVISPYAAEPRLVAEYQKRVSEILAGQQQAVGSVKLTVRSLVIRSVDADRDVEYSAPEMSTEEELAQRKEEQEQKKLEQQVLKKLDDLVQQTTGARVLEAQLREVAELANTNAPDARSQLFRIRAVIEGPRLYSYAQVVKWERQLSQELSTEGRDAVVLLTVENRVGTTIHPAGQSEELAQERTQRITQKLNALVGAVPGASLIEVDSVILERPPTDEEKGVIVVNATVLSPKALPGSTVKSWQVSLATICQRAGDDNGVRLLIQNQLGRLVTEDSPNPSPSPRPSRTGP